jgi:hypothetical protein
MLLLNKVRTKPSSVLCASWGFRDSQGWGGTILRCNFCRWPTFTDATASSIHPVTET